MTTNKRWKKAQTYEKDWWKSRVDMISFDFYEEYTQDLKKQIDEFIRISPSTSILEIGSGAGGTVTYLKSDDRNAVDPLEDYYGSVPAFQKQRDPDVNYQTARAENLPFDDQRFDLIICDNVLDHCENVQQVIREIQRTLRSGGILYLRVNVYTFWGKGIRWIVEKLNIDPGHPYTFTGKSMFYLFKDQDLKVLKKESQGFTRTWLKEIKSLKIKEWLKALTFSTPNKTLFIAGK